MGPTVSSTFLAQPQAVPSATEGLSQAWVHRSVQGLGSQKNLPDAPIPNERPEKLGFFSVIFEIAARIYSSKSNILIALQKLFLFIVRKNRKLESFFGRIAKLEFLVIPDQGSRYSSSSEMSRDSIVNPSFEDWKMDFFFPHWKSSDERQFYLFIYFGGGLQSWSVPFQIKTLICEILLIASGLLLKTLGWTVKVLILLGEFLLRDTLSLWRRTVFRIRLVDSKKYVAM